MEPGGSLPHSQEPATCPYPQPAQFSPCPHLTSWRSSLILSSNLRLGLPSDHLPTGLPTKILYAPLISPTRATCRAHLILLDLIHVVRLNFTQWNGSWNFHGKLDSAVMVFIDNGSIDLHYKPWGTLLNLFHSVCTVCDLSLRRSKSIS
jgi:hypothetical protein